MFADATSCITVTGEEAKTRQLAAAGPVTGGDWRLIFMAQKGILTFDFAGDHDEIQNYLRGHRK